MCTVKSIIIIIDDKIVITSVQKNIVYILYMYITGIIYYTCKPIIYVSSVYSNVIFILNKK